MGKRGPLPSVTPSAVEGVEPPADLHGEALAFFNRNRHVVRAVEDTDAFVLTCTLWAEIKTAVGREKTDYVRQFTALARQFGMTPDSRRRLKATAERHEDKTDFEF